MCSFIKSLFVVGPFHPQVSGLPEFMTLILTDRIWYRAKYYEKFKFSLTKNKHRALHMVQEYLMTNLFANHFDDKCNKQILFVMQYLMTWEVSVYLVWS